MKIDKQMRAIIDKRKNQEDWQDDDATQEYWDKAIEILTIDLDTTINYLKTISEDDVIWVAEVWDDLMEFYHSKELLDVFEECAIKYPFSKIDIDFMYAKYEYLNFKLNKDYENLKKKGIEPGEDKEYLDNLKELLSLDVRLTILYLGKNSKEKILISSLIWPDVIKKLKSLSVLDKMKSLINEYPEIGEILKTRYEEAKKVLEK